MAGSRSVSHCARDQILPIAAERSDGPPDSGPRSGHGGCVGTPGTVRSSSAAPGPGADTRPARRHPAPGWRSLADGSQLTDGADVQPRQQPGIARPGPLLAGRIGSPTTRPAPAIRPRRPSPNRVKWTWGTPRWSRSARGAPPRTTASCRRPAASPARRLRARAVRARFFLRTRRQRTDPAAAHPRRTAPNRSARSGRPPPAGRRAGRQPPAMVFPQLAAPSQPDRRHRPLRPARGAARRIGQLRRVEARRGRRRGRRVAPTKSVGPGHRRVRWLRAQRPQRAFPVRRAHRRGRVPARSERARRAGTERTAEDSGRCALYCGCPATGRALRRRGPGGPHRRERA